MSPKVAASPKVKRILEVLFPEKTSALIALIAGERSSAGPILPFFIFIFPGTVLPFTAHFGSTVPGKIVSAYRGRALHTHAGPILPFLFFRGQYFHFVIFP